jgi:GTP-binding protein EngB required for normal cell division
MGPDSLQSREQRDLFDIIDKLRSQGISKYVDLPEIIVCGDQSSGKSSVLEAISGMSFPTKDNLCTRFATELILRRTPEAEVSCIVSIIPDLERNEGEKAALSKFTHHIDTERLDLGDVVESAKNVMGLSEKKRFSSDILRVELCGPTQPHLTMVDLPGLFSAGNKDQSDEDAKMVKNLVRRHMKRPRSIILTVVSAKNDFANQQVTSLARKIDREGERTMGLITKPDTLHPGSDSEQSFLNLAQNKDVYFRLGWHVLRNRDFPERGCTSEERDEKERDFFAGSCWSTLSPTQLGVGELKPRLSNVLRDQIMKQLPDLLKDVEDGIRDCETRLKLLGPSRNSLKEQQHYLARVSQDFSRLMDLAVQGTYSDPFFGIVPIGKDSTESAKRLRAVIQNTLEYFSTAMRERGKSRRIIDTEGHFEPDSGKISRNDYIEEVQELMRRTRGRELPGTFNPLIIGDLFRQQCQPWRRLVEECQEEALQATHAVIALILEEVATPETRDAILQRINAGMERLKAQLSLKTDEALQQHYDLHPITYNHYLVDTVQKLQEDRRKKELERFLRCFREQYSDDPDGSWRTILQAQLHDLLEPLSRHLEVNMQKFSSSSAIDYMEAYFKVSTILSVIAVTAMYTPCPGQFMGCQVTRRRILADFP